MYLFKRASDGQWIFGPNIHCEISAGLLSIEPSDDSSQIMIRNSDGSVRLNPIPVTSFLKENGDAYADFAALKAGYAGFFFRVGGSAVGSDGFLYLPNTISSKGIRIGERTGWVYAVDVVLTPTGFSGVENTDWENVGGIEIV